MRQVRKKALRIHAVRTPGEPDAEFIGARAPRCVVGVCSNIRPKVPLERRSDINHFRHKKKRHSRATRQPRHAHRIHRRSHAPRGPRVRVTRHPWRAAPPAASCMPPATYVAVCRACARAARLLVISGLFLAQKSGAQITAPQRRRQATAAGHPASRSRYRSNRSPPPPAHA